MTDTQHPVSTRHLVDPEVADMLDSFPPFTFTAETLPLIREAMAQPRPGLPDPAELFPGVTRTLHHVAGLNGDPEVPVLLYEPENRAATAPGMVWIHGGGFVIGTAEGEDLTARRIAAETGAVVASVDYRLAPETRAPGSVHDCYAVLGWLHGQAGALSLDQSRIAVGGASAGGGLAACLSILARDRAEFPVSCQMLIYPMLDDRTASTADPHPYAGEFIWTPAANRFGWTALLGHEPGGDKVSPYAAAARVESTAGLPPAYISVGALDLFAEEDIDYARRLLSAGGPTELHVYPGAYHGYNMVAGARVTQAHFRDFIGALNRSFHG
jgi:acetyl esterase/lipase